MLLTVRSLALAALLLGLLACSERAGSGADGQPPGSDAARADLAQPDQGSDQAPDQRRDQTLDCPVLALGDGAAELGWQVAHVVGQGLHAISCVAGHVFAAGDKGTLLHRPPGPSLCTGFAAQSVPTEADLLTVSFADLSYGVTAGRQQEIWETRDGGQSWKVAPQCGDVVFSAFHSLHLHSASKGYGAGNAADPPRGAYKVFAGKVWICPEQTFANQLLYGAFRQEDRGWFVGDTGGRIYHTPNEGLSWFSSDTDALKPLRAVYFTPGGIGLAVGDESQLQRSTDGIGWSAVPMLGLEALTSVYFVDDENGWIVGGNGTILRTGDGGLTWTSQRAPVSERLEAVCFTSATQGWIAGAQGTILATTSGGE